VDQHAKVLVELVKLAKLSVGVLEVFAYVLLEQ